MARTAVITDGSGGIGLAIARALHAAGHRFALAARDPGRLAAHQSVITIF